MIANIMKHSVNSVVPHQDKGASGGGHAAT